MWQPMDAEMDFFDCNGNHDELLAFHMMDIVPTNSVTIRIPTAQKEKAPSTPTEIADGNKTAAGAASSPTASTTVPSTSTTAAATTSTTVLNTMMHELHQIEREDQMMRDFNQMKLRLNRGLKRTWPEDPVEEVE